MYSAREEDTMDALELGLAGKVAIVTGGSEGLGRATVERFEIGRASCRERV